MFMFQNDTYHSSGPVYYPRLFTLSFRNCEMVTVKMANLGFQILVQLFFYLFNFFVHAKESSVVYKRINI